MNRIMNLVVVGIVGLATVAGCDTAPKNKGAHKSRAIESRTPGEGARPGSADLATATEQAVESMVKLIPELRQGEKITIVMDRIENKTSDPSANFEIYLARIIALLNESGAKYNLTFVT